MELRRKVLQGKVIDATVGKPIIAQVSTENVDLAGDIIRQGPSDEGAGWLLDDFNSRGRVYWMHDPLRPNLAKASASVDDGRLLLSVHFDQGDEFAREIERKYREGFLSEWSVGFRPVDGKYTDNEHGGYTFFEQHLDEVSAVNQGMNQNTATISKAYADYLDSAAETRAMLEAYEARLREVEAAIMKNASESEQQKQARALSAAFDDLKRARAAV